MTFVAKLMATALLLTIFLGVKKTKTYLSGDLSCSFKTVFFSMTEQNSFNFNFCVGLVLDDIKSISVAVTSLTES